MKSFYLSLQMTALAGYCYRLHGDAARMMTRANGSIRRCSTAHCTTHLCGRLEPVHNLFRISRKGKHHHLQTGIAFFRSSSRAGGTFARQRPRFGRTTRCEVRCASPLPPRLLPDFAPTSGKGLPCITPIEVPTCLRSAPRWSNCTIGDIWRWSRELLPLGVMCRIPETFLPASYRRCQCS